MTGGLVIAIDGPSGVGKSTTSKLLARELGLRYIDTGAMYRAVALALSDAKVDIEDEAALGDFLSSIELDFVSETASVVLNSEDMSERIREPHVGGLTSKASAKSPVRSMLVARQREMAGDGSVVMEGRDIGTVVLPDADIKFFLTASHEVRAKRRHGELSTKSGFSDISKEMKRRDERDSTRKDSPLTAADDAIVIDTGELDIEGVLNKILEMVGER